MIKGPFKETPHTKEICSKLKDFYGEIKPYLPIIVALKNPNVKQRHFDLINKCKDPPFAIDDKLQVSLSDLRRQGIMDYVDELTEISETASKEKQLEGQLNKMKDEWKTIKLSFVKFSTSDT